MRATPDTPAYVLLEHYAMQCAALSRTAHGRARQILKVLAIDLLFEAERRRKQHPITDIGLSNFSHQTVKAMSRG